jgi:hypothetical protein
MTLKKKFKIEKEILPKGLVFQQCNKCLRVSSLTDINVYKGCGAKCICGNYIFIKKENIDNFHVILNFLKQTKIVKARMLFSWAYENIEKENYGIADNLLHEALKYINLKMINH